ncbi:hypothetical protein SAMN04490190_1313 [Pseudomonas libanensis]|nr:hypothetical protein SAMN04490190_1313 [Pseudomonas libanensis]
MWEGRCEDSTAPDGHGYLHNSDVATVSNHDAKRAALDLDLDLLLISGAPLNHAGRNSTGIWGVNRQGCRFSRPAPWMARGGGPPNPCRITGTPSLGEVPSGGARAFWLLLRFSKVTRCKSGTNSGRYRSNGYVHGLIQHPGRLSGRHRGQAPSHIWTETTRQILVGCQAAIGGKPPPTFGPRPSVKYWSAAKPPSGIKPPPTFGPGHSFSAREVWPSQPPPSAAISCTLATNRDCSKFSTVRSLLRAVACTVTTSR